MASTVLYAYTRIVLTRGTERVIVEPGGKMPSGVDKELLKELIKNGSVVQYDRTAVEESISLDELDSGEPEGEGTSEDKSSENE